VLSLKDKIPTFAFSESDISSFDVIQGTKQLLTPPQLVNNQKLNKVKY